MEYDGYYASKQFASGHVGKKKMMGWEKKLYEFYTFQWIY